MSNKRNKSLYSIDDNAIVEEVLIDNEKRLILHIKSIGCAWHNSSKGCVMCGFHKTARSQPTDQLLSQEVSQIVKRYAQSCINEIDIYCAGNFFNEDEISAISANNIFRIISDWKNIKKIVVESRPEYINSEKLRTIKDIIPEKELIIGMGFECFDDDIMKKIINKGYGEQEIKDAVAKMNGYAKPRAYVLLKPPFFSEKQAIEYCVKTAERAGKIGIDDIHIESMKVQEGTFVHSLYNAQLYKPPSIWSLISVIEQLDAKGCKFYVSPCEYNVPAIAWIRCCDNCRQSKIWENIQLSNLSHNVSLVRGYTCGCKNDWINETENADDQSIKERALEYLWKLNHM